MYRSPDPTGPSIHMNRVQRRYVERMYRRKDSYINRVKFEKRKLR